MWIYKGKSWLPGVPARDLTDAEMKEYQVESSGLYERAPAPRKPSKDRGDNRT
jgi:hypothetical protein